MYDTRPEICRVDAMHKHMAVKIDIEEFYRLNEQACKVLQDEELNRTVAVSAGQQAGVIEGTQLGSAGVSSE